MDQGGPICRVRSGGGTDDIIAERKPGANEAAEKVIDDRRAKHPARCGSNLATRYAAPLADSPHQDSQSHMLTAAVGKKAARGSGATWDRRFRLLTIAMNAAMMVLQDGPGLSHRLVDCVAMHRRTILQGAV